MHFNRFLIVAATAVHGCFAITLQELVATNPDLAGYKEVFKTAPAVLDDLAAQKNQTLFLSNADSFKRNAKLVKPVLGNVTRITELAKEISVSGYYPTSSFAGRGKILHTNLILPNAPDGSPLKAQNKKVKSGRDVTSKITKADIAYDNGIVQILDEFIFLPVGFQLTAIITKNVGLSVAELFVEVAGRPKPPPKETFISYTGKAWIKLSYLSLYKPKEFITFINSYQVINTTVVYGPEVPESGISVPTVAGPPLKFTTNENGKLFVNGLRTVEQDILVDNGVYHIVDNIVAPPGTNLSVPNYNVTNPTQG